MIGRWLVPMLYRKQGEIDHRLRSLPRLKKGEVRKILDIGCGSGAFIKDAMNLGWEAYGLDPDPNAGAKMAGLCVVRGGLPETGLPDTSFDVVTLSHVIEHTHDPVASLHEVFRLLKPGGQAWITTPNVTSDGHRRFHENWIGLHPPAHLILFSPTSIMHALDIAGFEGRIFAGMHPPTAGYYHMSWLVERGESPFGEGVSPLPFSLRIRAALDDLLASLSPNRREEIVVIAKKPIEANSRVFTHE
jgi:SAM-dependent methyltransferase